MANIQTTTTRWNGNFTAPGDLVDQLDGEIAEYMRSLDNLSIVSTSGNASQLVSKLANGADLVMNGSNLNSFNAIVNNMDYVDPLGFGFNLEGKIPLLQDSGTITSLRIYAPGLDIAASGKVLLTNSGFAAGTLTRVEGELDGWAVDYSGKFSISASDISGSITRLRIVNPKGEKLEVANTRISMASLDEAGNPANIFTDHKALSGNDQIRSANRADKLNGYNGNDLLDAKGGDDILKGGNGNDRLLGGRGKDQLLGGLHDDLLIGHAGTDKLGGGKGADRFHYINASQGGDTITDFFRNQGDKVSILGKNFNGLTAGTLQQQHFRSNAKGIAKDGNDYFVFNTSNQTLYFDSNGNQAGGVRKLATFSNGAKLRYSDIVVV